MKLKKTFSLLISGALCFCSLAGCVGNGKDSSEAASKELTWVFGGAGKLEDSDMVWEEYNKLLNEKLPGTSIQFQSIPLSDFGEKWKMMAAAREKVDLVWSGYVLNLQEEVNKGAFIPLDDLLETYGQDLKKELPEWVFEKSKIDGKLYFIPCYQMMADVLPIGIRTQKELSDQYLDKEAVARDVLDKEPLTKDDFKVFEDYLEKLKQNGEIRKGVSQTFFTMYADKIGFKNSDTQLIANAYIDIEDPTFTVKDLLTDYPQSYEVYDLANDWFKKGYIRQDILGLQDWRADEGKENGYVMWAHIDMLNPSETETATCGFPVEVVPVTTYSLIGHNPSTTNTSISSTSENPELAMQVIDLMNTKKGHDLYNLLVYGIEGIHYTKVGDDRIEMNLQGTAFTNENKYGYYAWVLGNTMNAYSTQLDPEGYKEFVENEINQKAETSNLMGFSLDLAPIENEINQYNAVMKEYEYLSLGATDNYKELLEERNAKLKSVGSDKIIEEVQRQVTAWAKENGKLQ